MSKAEAASSIFLPVAMVRYNYIYSGPLLYSKLMSGVLQTANNKASEEDYNYGPDVRIVKNPADF
jgi:hypothetical protein